MLHWLGDWYGGGGIGSEDNSSAVQVVFVG